MAAKKRSKRKKKKEGIGLFASMKEKVKKSSIKKKTGITYVADDIPKPKPLVSHEVIPEPVKTPPIPVVKRKRR